VNSHDERRTTPRYELTVALTFESEHNFYTGATRDLGGGGLFVATKLLRPVGECVRVRFTLPGSDVLLDAITEVRWVRANAAEGEAGIGLEFLQMSSATKQAVKAYLSKRDSIVHTKDG
jgi:uncharacterized protein (TIGR02266 family)